MIPMPPFEIHAGIRLDGRHTIEIFQEVEMPIGTTKLAIGDGLEADLFLTLDQRTGSPDLRLLSKPHPGFRRDGASHAHPSTAAS